MWVVAIQIVTSLHNAEGKEFNFKQTFVVLEYHKELQFSFMMVQIRLAYVSTEQRSAQMVLLSQLHTLRHSCTIMSLFRTYLLATTLLLLDCPAGLSLSFPCTEVCDL